MSTEEDRNPLIDVSNSLVTLAEEIAEGHISEEEVQERLYGAAHRIRPDEGREEQVHRVGVVVFVEVKAVDARDAGHIAERVVGEAVPEGTIGTHHIWPYRISETMEIGMAVRNGYARTTVTSQAWRADSNRLWDGRDPATELDDEACCDEAYVDAHGNVGHQPWCVNK